MVRLRVHTTLVLVAFDNELFMGCLFIVADSPHAVLVGIVALGKPAPLRVLHSFELSSHHLISVLNRFPFEVRQKAQVFRRRITATNFSTTVCLGWVGALVPNMEADIFFTSLLHLVPDLARAEPGIAR